VPRIIRKTEIIVDTDDEKESKYAQKEDKKDSKAAQKQNFVRRSDNTSGLRPGLVRTTEADLIRDYLSQKDIENKKKKEEEKKAETKREVKVTARPDSKVEDKPNAGVNAKAETRTKAEEANKAKVDGKADAKTDNKAEIKPGAKHDVNAAEKAEAHEVKIDAGHGMKHNEETKQKTEVKANEDDNKKVRAENNKVTVVDEKEKLQTIERKNDETMKKQEDTDKDRAESVKHMNMVETKNQSENSKDTNKHGKIDAAAAAAKNVKSGAETGIKKDEVKEIKTENKQQEQNIDTARQHGKNFGNQNVEHHVNPNEGKQVKNEAQKDKNIKQNNRTQESKQQDGKPQDNRHKSNYQRNFADSKHNDARDGRAGKTDTGAKEKVDIGIHDLFTGEDVKPRREMKKAVVNKEDYKEEKKETKKDVIKNGDGERSKRFKPQKSLLSGKKDISEILSDDFELDDMFGEESRRRKAQKPKKEAKKEAKKTEQDKHVQPKPVLTSIKIGESITVKELAEALKKTAAEVIKKLMAMGVMATLNQELDFDTAAIIADEFNVKVEKEVVVNEEDILFDNSEDDESELQPRAPVVVVMGHVDHGKTSLLDAIRKTNVIDTEAGGITQHIGAYMVNVQGRNITFLDTPGHEAFTAMRARGAKVTDIAVIVVAADDGVMPQTVEAINHAKAAGVSIIVAINKIDKPGADPERVKQELTEYGLVPEEWGGDTICVPVSAKQRKNIDQLLEMILLTADILELKANPNKQAKGTIIEAKLDKNSGPVATVIVQRGTLSVGDSIISGTTLGRIKAMKDYRGQNVKTATPSMPVEILGLSEVPEAGDEFYVITDEKLAKQLVEKRKLKQREAHMKATTKVSLDALFEQIKEGKVKDLNIIVKADVQGSVEAVKQSLEKLSNDEVRVKIIHGGVGAINESDVTLASVSNAIIIGFNVRPGANVAEAAKNAGVDIRLYTIIYDAIEDVEAAMKGMLEPKFKEVLLGHAEIRQIFKVSGVGTVGGAYVLDGKIVRNSDVRLVRDGIVVMQGKLASLKRFKDDVREVAAGFECGLQIERFNDIKEGDIVESYVMEEVKE